jgi:ubiquinone biosynthesis protein UbiJ
MAALSQELDKLAILLIRHLTLVDEELTQLQSILDDAAFKLTEGLSQIAINTNTDSLVIALQFHDLSRQLLEHSQARIEGMLEVLGDARQGLQNHPNARKAWEMFDAINQKMAELDRRLRRPVRHVNMDSGDITLY